MTIDVVLSEIGDIRRFRSQRKATAFAGLAPGIRERRPHQAPGHHQGRLAAVAVGAGADRLAAGESHPAWTLLYDKLKRRCGTKKAIVAIARRVWCVMVAMLKSGTQYRGVSQEALVRTN